MISVTTERFRKCYKNLPEHIKESAQKSYALWKQHPQHRSLQFKLIHNTQPIYSVRINLAWRAIGIKQKNTMIWFWIGSHAEYDKLISTL